MTMKILNRFIDDCVNVFQYRFMDTFYNPQNHPDEFLKRNGSVFSEGLKRSGSILSKNE